MAGIFAPYTPASVVIQLLRTFCDETATNHLTKLIQGEASKTDLTISADQKQHFLDLWSGAVFAIGVTARDRLARSLCAAAANSAARLDPRQSGIQGVARAIVAQSIDAEGGAARIADQLLDQAFGPGSFDHAKTTRAFPGAELGMCVRYSTHLLKVHKVRF